MSERDPEVEAARLTAAGVLMLSGAILTPALAWVDLCVWAGTPDWAARLTGAIFGLGVVYLTAPGRFVAGQAASVFAAARDLRRGGRGS